MIPILSLPHHQIGALGAYHDVVGCAEPYPQQRPYAVQPFERGDVWIQDFVTGRMFFPLDQGTVYLQQSGQMIEVPYIAELP